MIPRTLRKPLALAVASAMLWLTPGLACYQALAGDINSEESQGLQPAGGNLGGVSAPQGALDAPLAINSQALEGIYQLPGASISGAPATAAGRAAGMRGSKSVNGFKFLLPQGEKDRMRANVYQPAAPSPRPSPLQGEGGYAGKRAAAHTRSRPSALGWLRKNARGLTRWLKPNSAAAGLKFGAGQAFDVPARGEDGVTASSPHPNLLPQREKRSSALARSASFLAPGALIAAAAVPVPAKAAIAASAAAAAHGGLALAAHAAIAALHAASLPAYYVGNFLATIMVLPEVYRTFKQGGSHKAPGNELAMGTLASLIFGLIVAPRTGKWFWAGQNTYGGLTMLVVPLVGKTLGRGGFKMLGRTFLAPSPSAKTNAWRTAAVALAIFGATAVATALLVALGPAVFPPALGFIASLFPATAAGMRILTGAALLVPAYYALKWLRVLMKSRAAASKKIIFGLALVAALPALAWLWPAAAAWAFPMTADKIVALFSGVASGIFVFLFAPEVINALLMGEASTKRFNVWTSLLFSLNSAGFLIYWLSQYFVDPAIAGVAFSNILQDTIGGIFSTIGFFMAWRHRGKEAAKKDKDGNDVAASGMILYAAQARLAC